MNLYFVEWTQKDPDMGYTTIENCAKFVLAANETRAKWTVGQIEFCRPIRDLSFVATLITSEEHLTKFCQPQYFNSCFVEDERDYADDADWNEVNGDFLTCNLLPEKPSLLDSLREMWRQQENEQKAKDLQVSLALC